MPQTFTQTITTTLYTFQELLDAEEAGQIDGKAVDKARCWLQEGNNHDSFWSEDVRDTWKQALDQIGFEDAEILFSGFCSQGDGASFTARPDLEKLVEFLVTRWQPEPAITVRKDGKTEEFRPWACSHIGWEGGEKQYAKLITWYTERDLDLGLSCTRHTSHYVHWNTCSFEAHLGNISYKQERHYQAAEKLVKEFEERVEGLRKDLCQEIYKSLEDAYEYINSDPALVETAEANDYLFTAGGRREDPPVEENAATPSPDKPALVVPQRPLLDRLRAKRKLVRHG